ncbi:tyrosine-type recombinase/integrase [Ensifer aridi]|uniref:tyrosine-type recombinase/integrase n=1 Tax=Ensifer aridi TaxID=1708715 RepID=UPI000A0F6EBA|nr:tyrosine-type recombinase/integrase [Ensifer aridi]
MNISPTVQIDAKEWIALAAATLPQRPPYRDDMQVTSKSKFGDMVWEFDASDLPAGSRSCRFLKFLATVRIGSTKCRLHHSDALLINELKECIVAFMFRQSVLQHKRKLTIPKPLSVYHFLQYIRRFFVWLKKVGLRTIGGLKQKNLDKILSGIHITNKEYNKFVNNIAVLMIFIDHDYLSSKPDINQIKLEERPVIEDTSREKGAQTLTDTDLSIALSASRFYIDNFENILIILDDCRSKIRSTEETAKHLFRYLPLTAPLHPFLIVSVVASLIRIAGYNFLGWHLGARISEVLSAKKGFVSPLGNEAMLVLEAMELQLETRKAIADLHGKVRAFSVHPYLARVAHVLEKLNDFLGIESDFIFVQPRVGKIYASNDFNHQIKRFATLHGYSRDISSHTWRNTLVSVTIRSIAEPLGPLAHLLGHKHLSTVVGYAFSNPFVRKEMRRALFETMAPRVDRFLDGSQHFGGTGLRGPQGAAIENSIASRLERGSSVEVVRQQTSHELLDRNLTLLPVEAGIDCVKPPLARGRCTHKNGDILADAEQCHEECPFRTESDAAREKLFDDINQTAKYFNEPETSILMKVRWASDLMRRLHTWPELTGNLVQILRLNPIHWKFFEELQNG